MSEVHLTKVCKQCGIDKPLECYAINAFRGRMTDAEMLAMAKAIVANLEPAEPVVGLLSLVA